MHVRIAFERALPEQAVLPCECGRLRAGFQVHEKFGGWGRCFTGPLSCLRGCCDCRRSRGVRCASVRGCPGATATTRREQQPAEERDAECLIQKPFHWCWRNRGGGLHREIPRIQFDQGHPMKRPHEKPRRNNAVRLEAGAGVNDFLAALRRKDPRYALSYGTARAR